MSTVTFEQGTSNSATLEGVHNATLDVFAQFSHVPDLQWKFVYTPIPNFYTERGTERGGNVMGLNNTINSLISEYTFDSCLCLRLTFLQWSA